MEKPVNMSESLSDKIFTSDNMNDDLHVFDVREAVKKLKDFLDVQRKAINDLFDANGEYPDERMLAHLHTNINQTDDRIDKIFGEKLC